MIYYRALILATVLGTIFAPRSDGNDWFSCPVEIYFQVVDDNGQPVEAVNVEGYFWSPYTHDAVGDSFRVHTDNDGLCLLRGTGYSHLAGVVQAEGYYKTEFDISLGDKSVAREQGQWTLKNAIVRLKNIRNPIPMYANRVVTEIPEQNKPIGFDMEKGDWVDPYGAGLVADVYITYSLAQEDLWTGSERFELSNTNLLCGLQELSADTFSGFRSLYEAPLAGYEGSLEYVLNRTKTKVVEEKRLDDSSYIVFRSRVVVDDEQRVESANYGKIYPPIKHGRLDDKDHLVLIYYFNPTPNDRNLEFDMSRNLLPGGLVNKP